MVANNRNQQIPGGVYGVDSPSGSYINRANETGEWNTLVIDFRPPSLDPADRTVIRRAARIKTVLNRHVVFDGAITDSDCKPLRGTGVRRGAPTPVTRGYIYLQSHWGSQVEFRDPVIEEVRAGGPEEAGHAERRPPGASPGADGDQAEPTGDEGPAGQYDAPA